MTETPNVLLTTVFVEHPLALPKSVKKKFLEKLFGDKKKNFFHFIHLHKRLFVISNAHNHYWILQDRLLIFTLKEKSHSFTGPTFFSP